MDLIFVVIVVCIIVYSFLFVSKCSQMAVGWTLAILFSVCKGTAWYLYGIATSSLNEMVKQNENLMKRMQKGWGGTLSVFFWGGIAIRYTLSPVFLERNFGIFTTCAVEIIKHREHRGHRGIKSVCQEMPRHFPDRLCYENNGVSPLCRGFRTNGTHHCLLL